MIREGLGSLYWFSIIRSLRPFVSQRDFSTTEDILHGYFFFACVLVASSGFYAHYSGFLTLNSFIGYI